MSVPLPVQTRRLFSELGPEDLDQAPPSPFVIGRLLEEGDSADLRWLAGTVGEPLLGTWLTERGARQLSQRSRAFWRLLLDPKTRDPSPAADGTEGIESTGELWLL